MGKSATFLRMTRSRIVWKRLIANSLSSSTQDISAHMVMMPPSVLSGPNSKDQKIKLFLAVRMTGYAQECNYTIHATSTQSATSACIAMRAVAAWSTRRSVRGAHPMRPAVENPCAFSRLLSPHTGHARKSSPCQRTHWSCPCTRPIWLIQILAFSFINKISRKCAALVISTKPRVAVSPDWSPKIRYCKFFL